MKVRGDCCIFPWSHQAFTQKIANVVAGQALGLGFLSRLITSALHHSHMVCDLI